jgi:hypothetical protein
MMTAEFNFSRNHGHAASNIKRSQPRINSICSGLELSHISLVILLPHHVVIVILFSFSAWSISSISFSQFIVTMT